MGMRGRAARGSRQVGGLLLLSILTAGGLRAQASAGAGAGAGGQPGAACGGPPALVTPVAAAAPDAGAPQVVRSAMVPATVALPTRMLSAPLPADAGGEAVAVTPSDETAIARHGRWHVYVHDLIGPGALIGVGASAAIDQWQTSPPEWGTGGSGFGKRLASRGGQLVAQETVRHGLAAILRRDPEYQRCGCSDFSGRLNNALAESVTDINESGHRVISVPRIAGSFAGAFAPLLWRPGLTVPQATRDGALGLLFNAAGNLVTEYIHIGGEPRTAQATRRSHHRR